MEQLGLPVNTIAAGMGELLGIDFRAGRDGSRTAGHCGTLRDDYTAPIQASNGPSPYINITIDMLWITVFMWRFDEEYRSQQRAFASCLHDLQVCSILLDS